MINTIMNIAITIINITIAIGLVFLTHHLKKKGELLLEEVKAQNQSRLAILPEQIQKYQEASTLLIKTLQNIFNSAELPTAIRNCQEWYNENHVYLDLEAQRSFKEAYPAVKTHEILIRAKAPTKELEENWLKITKALELFQQGLQLPRPTFQKQKETSK